MHSYSVCKNDRVLITHFCTGPNAHCTAQRLCEVLGAGNSEYTHLIYTGETCLPTIRIVAPGTFMEYRRRRCEEIKTGLGQIKVLVVLSHAESVVWISERMIQEL